MLFRTFSHKIKKKSLDIVQCERRAVNSSKEQENRFIQLYRIEFFRQKLTKFDYPLCHPLGAIEFSHIIGI